jgi:hypothetical protein
MHPSISLFTALLLAVPLAAAGGIDASVGYFSPATGGCETADEGSYQSGSYFYYDDQTGAYHWYDWSSGTSTETEDCSESYDTLAVDGRTDDRELASARVGGGNSTEEERTYESGSSRSGWYHPVGNSTWSGDSYEGSYSSDYAWRQSWDRTVEAHAAGEDVVVSRGCGYDSHGGYSSTGSWGSSANDGRTSEYAGSDWGGHWASQTGCRDGAAAAGADAGRIDGCSSDSVYASESDSWSSDDFGSYGSSYETSSDEYGCRSGVAADVAGASAFAGSRSSCESWSTSWSWWNADNSTEGSRGREACENAPLAIEGPEGMTILVGTWSQGESRCDDDACEDWSDTRTGISVAWARSPLGPTEYRLTQPLP